MKPQVGIIMGSDSDLEVMCQAAKILDDLGIINEVLILSTHRAPEETAKYAQSAKSKGIKVIIAGAGGSAALPGSIASLTSIPVIGVPIKTKSLDGLDSLLSIVQMPPGVPVATVGINAAKNAGILAAQIIGAQNTKISAAVTQYKDKLRKEVFDKNAKIKNIGWEKYLKDLPAGRQGKI